MFTESSHVRGEAGGRMHMKLGVHALCVEPERRRALSQASAVPWRCGGQVAPFATFAIGDA